jgi:hypothetical protein
MANCDPSLLKRLQENAALSAEMIAGTPKANLSKLQKKQVALLTRLEFLKPTADHYPFVGAARNTDHK